MIIPKRCIYITIPDIDLESLEEGCKKLKFRDCSKEAEESWGFYQPDELSQKSDIFMYRVDRYALINLRHDRKKLNKSKLSRAWRQKLEEEEKKAGIVFDKTQRKEIMTNTAKTLLRDVDPSESYLKAVIDKTKSVLYVLVSNATHAEFLIDKVNRALEIQDVKIHFSIDDYKKNELSETLTNWLNTPNSANEFDFELGDNMMLAGDDDSSATLKHQNAESSEVKEHLHSSKMVKKLELKTSLSEGTNVSFVTTADRILSQIDLKGTCSEMIKEERTKQDDIDSLKAAEFLILFSALGDLCDKVESIPAN
jgi:DNA recombination-dependent growth factor C